MSETTPLDYSATYTTATQLFMAQHGTFDVARSAIFKRSIRTSSDETRVVFSAAHNSCNNPNIYARECNGLILEKDTWRPLMVPPRNLRTNIDTAAADKFLHTHEYHVYFAMDGTCFNLYYYNDKWCISTTRGYEMNDTKWVNLTYQEIVTECLEKLLNCSWENFLSSLSKNHCYSFGFRHPEFHKFHGGDVPKYYVWFIQSVNLDRESPEYLQSSDEPPMDNIPPQKIVDFTFSNMHVLYKKASKALENYILDTDTSPCFGFILRSRDAARTGPHSDLFVESSLMRTIRRVWYDSTLNNLCHANEWNKETAITLNSYLTTDLTETFVKLFPQYIDTITGYHTVIDRVMKNMLSMYNGKVDADEDKSYIDVAETIMRALDSNVDYNLTSKDEVHRHRVIHEYLVHPDNLETLMRLF